MGHETIKKKKLLFSVLPMLFSYLDGEDVRSAEQQPLQNHFLNRILRVMSPMRDVAPFTCQHRKVELGVSGDA